MTSRSFVGGVLRLRSRASRRARATCGRAASRSDRRRATIAFIVYTSARDSESQRVEHVHVDLDGTPILPAGSLTGFVMRGWGLRSAGASQLQLRRGGVCAQQVRANSNYVGVPVPPPAGPAGPVAPTTPEGIVCGGPDGPLDTL